MAREYADETRLAARRRVWREFLEGENADEWTFRAIAEGLPRHVLEVGGGWGELAERVARELGADVTATDLSPRMAELARDRGVRALVADVQGLPFRDGAFDTVVANAMLYHVPDLDLALQEVGRLLAPGGRLVATTFDAGRFPELFELAGVEPPELGFQADDGARVLRTRFADVEERRGRHALAFPNAVEVRTYLRSTITMSHLADHVPEGPLRTERTFAVFIARTPRSTTEPSRRPPDG